MDIRLDGRTALITGGSKGLGLAMAQKFAESGANVVLAARDAATLAAAEAEINATHQGAAKAIPTDVTDPEACKALYVGACAQYGQVDILVNNAGVYGPKGEIESVDWAEWVKTIEINVYGSILMCRALLPHFKAQRYGKVIQLSGGGATNPLPRISAYAVSKAAIVRFAETLAEEVRGIGIDVNAIAPGFFVASRNRSRYEERKEQILGEIPLHRPGGDNDLKGPIVFLASDASDFVTGAILSVDGGRTAW